MQQSYSRDRGGMMSFSVLLVVSIIWAWIRTFAPYALQALCNFSLPVLDISRSDGSWLEHRTVRVSVRGATYVGCPESIKPIFFLKKSNRPRTVVPQSPSKYSPWDLTHIPAFLPLFKTI
jgi:hypothetical protein